MIEHLKHMATVRPQGSDKQAAEWAVSQIERLTRERDEWKEKWVALAQAALIVGGPVQRQLTSEEDKLIRQALDASSELAGVIVQEEVPAKHCNGGYVREPDAACAVCGAGPQDDCRARFTDALVQKAGGSE